MNALQQYLETRIEAERGIIEERFAAQALALKLQSEEYARRLGDLNNAHMRADRLAEKIIGRDMYELDRDRNATDHEEFKHDLTVIQTRSLTWTAVWGSAAVILTLIINIVMHFLK